MNNFKLQTIIKLNQRRERRELVGSAVCTALIALLVWLFFMIAPVEASNSPSMRFSDNVKDNCLGSSSIACYRSDIDTIFLSTSIEPENFMYVFLHEYGHALTLGLPRETLQSRYGNNCYEDVADSFYLFVKYPTLRTPESISFWSSLLTDTRVP